ncbi:large-conductance mechanosensitive channel protein MscL [Mycobacterium sp. CBMA271]|uniref:large-conductance mechanosensitive channel protein MscL n=1 Tax=unclassified Mycobacteroides TaxID=2618759 RepID=UPI0012DF8FFC|nr:MULTISPECIES: large-conductance mechanosensitive channel protein MscL [unclassified Mycobacteroides]MUM15577.1 mechanosensitive ion channel protein MscL [Mycobacteroides sp. CBMA 326]MUM17372.1 mechanosensitive ion channel protein MscL [Mycobacteroides sp. CBMA 326]MUM21846.1 large-conductance mechanosensitive channel protein MscL [Mycobacteroides sp. CBMA 271]
MLKGFRDFLLRGNVIDLAVAVVVGGAFTAIVKSFNDAIIQPLLSRVGASGDQKHGVLQVSLGGNPEQFLQFDALLSAAISFVITAAVVYFLIVLPYKALKDRLSTSGEDAAAATEAELLVEIRDLLAEQRKAS